MTPPRMIEEPDQRRPLRLRVWTRGPVTQPRTGTYGTGGGHAVNQNGISHAGARGKSRFRSGRRSRYGRRLQPPRRRGCEMSSDDLGLTVERLRRDDGAWVLAVSGEFSLRSAGSVERGVSKALADTGRVLLDLSGLRLTWAPVVRVFPSILARAGGWPGARLVLFGAGPELARSMTALRVSTTVPVAPHEAAAHRLLERRPPAVTRYTDLDRAQSPLPGARLFVEAACTDWQCDAVREDAVLVASELVSNAVLHAGTGCRLTLRYTALGMTVAVRDDRPD